MRTVKEISKITGISVRTLHYYDEIGLLKPSEVSEARYRLYDDTALEKLQQILFFREFDMPLKEIKAIMENPDFDRNQILQSQRQMLVRKKVRLERLITSIDGILQGENEMDFEIFSKEDMETMYQSMLANMTEEQQEKLCSVYGSIEQYHKHFLKNASSSKTQKKYAKMVEWYGDKESALQAATNPKNPNIVEVYQKRVNEIMGKLAAKKGMDVHAFEVKEIVGEYDFVAKQLYQMKDVTALMGELAKEYQNNKELQKAQDLIYGEGTTAYIGKALEVFYQ